MRDQAGPSEKQAGGRRGWIRVLLGATATSLLVGYAVAAKAFEARPALELVASRQWFKLGDVVSSALFPWIPISLGIGLAVAIVVAGLGRYQFAPRPFQRRLWQLLVVSAVGVSLVVFGLSMTALLRPKPNGPNALLIVLDTARPDRMSLYGYERPTTPNLEALASESTVFTRAYSTTSWTPPSHASLFTGLFACEHGVTHEAARYPPRMPTRFLTLAEILWEAGYRTAAFVGNPILHASTGFPQGFDEYHEMWRLAHREGRHPVERLLARLLEDNSDRPFFVFVNLLEPHSPYNSSEQFFGHYDRHPDLESLVDIDWIKYFTGDRVYTQRELEHLSDLYDEEIQYVDSLIGKMVGLLSEHDVLDETMLIVTSDHGEHFGEHGLVKHLFNLYETNVRVPLLIRYPNGHSSGVRDSSLVQLHDLFETTLSTAGAGGRHRSEGSDLSTGPAPQRPVFLEYYAPVTAFRDWAVPASLDHFKRRLRAVRSHDLKLIVGSDGSRELYDVARDSLELENLIGRDEYAAESMRLQALLQDRFRACQEDPTVESAPIELDERTLQELRSLGYIP